MKGALAWPFMRLYGLTLLYFSANAILTVLIPLKGDSLGAANSAIGIIMGAYLFTTMLFRPWAGRFIQKYGPVKVLRAVLVINGSALLLYTCTGLEGYFAARVLQGVCTAFFSMALQLGMIDALPDEHRSQGISMYSLCSYIPGIFGPLLALGIWQAGNSAYFTAAMLFIAVSTVAVGFSAKIDAKEEAAPDREDQGTAAAMKGFAGWFRHPELVKCSVLMLAASAVFGAASVFVPLYAEQVKGGNAGVFLMLQAAVVVGSRFTLRAKIPSDGKWRPLLMMGMMLVLAAGAACLSLAASHGAGYFYAGAVFIGIAQALLYPTLTTYLTFVLPKAGRNERIGLFIASADLGVSMGGMLMGPVADLVSYPSMYGICALLAASMTVAAYRRRRQPKALSL
ncbi:MFS transporter [Paenibacillus nanensis]|uniref:MFS transporter n=1 Tax=Paenibacillus nanensis TaxID=393251 RepID=A0A3A1VJ34_9BACL|nr:MFS transporter [Paenibacillus nanensis]RIX60265.1 MFS transporter [Paenibacillus nanensis]